MKMLSGLFGAAAGCAPIGAVTSCCLLALLAAPPASGIGAGTAKAWSLDRPRESGSVDAPATMELVIRIQLGPWGAKACAQKSPPIAERASSIGPRPLERPSPPEQPVFSRARCLQRSVALVRIFAEIADCLLRHWIAGMVSGTVLN